MQGRACTHQSVVGQANRGDSSDDHAAATPDRPARLMAKSMAGMEQQANPFAIASMMSGTGDQAHLHITFATVVVSALVIFVTAFLLGLWCGWMWQRRRG